MSISWAICPICGKQFEGSYFPDTGVNTAVGLVEKHLLLKHRKKLENGKIRDAVPMDYISTCDLILQRNTDGKLIGTASIYCICGKEFNIRFEAETFPAYTLITIKINDKVIDLPIFSGDIEAILNNIWVGLRNKIIEEHIKIHL